MAARVVLLTLGLALVLHAPAARAALPARAPSCDACHATHAGAVGTCVGCHRGNAAVARPELAHDRLLRGAAAAWGVPRSPAVEAGARLREALGCRRCHVSGGRGEEYAIALDRVVWRRSQEALRHSILAPATFMPDFALSESQADRLIAVLLRDADPTGAEERYLVRFRPEAGGGGSPFERRCGPCHRALTRGGPRGSAATGPNLTGLRGAHYPVADGRRWDRRRLEQWIENPRSQRPGATMPPLALSREERDAVIVDLEPEPAR